MAEQTKTGQSAPNECRRLPACHNQLFNENPHCRFIILKIPPWLIWQHSLGASAVELWGKFPPWAAFFVKIYNTCPELFVMSQSVLMRGLLNSAQRKWTFTQPSSVKLWRNRKKYAFLTGGGTSTVTVKRVFTEKNANKERLKRFTAGHIKPIWQSSAAKTKMEMYEKPTLFSWLTCTKRWIHLNKLTGQTVRQPRSHGF